MISFEEFAEILDDLANKLPGDIYVSLNGGINLLPDEVLHDESDPSAPLFVMGEYNVNRLGRYINIYYGSFMQTYGHLPAKKLAKKIGSTLRHEFLHHLESLAGENGLETQDMMELDEYKRQLGR